MAAPRPDQPGRRRHRADAVRPRRGRRGRAPRCASRSAAWPTWSSSHRATPMVARTLTQHAVPTTFGLKAAGWLTGVLDAYDAASRAGPPGAGRRRRRHHGRDRRARRRPRRPGRRGHVARRSSVATALGLTASTPWHTTRSHRHPARRRGRRLHRRAGAGSPPTSLTLSRPEIGELSEGSGRRVVDDAAQGQPGARHARPPRRADQPAARRDPPRRRRRRRRRAPRRGLARRVGHPADPAAPDRRRRRPDHRAAGGPARCTPTGWPRRSTAASDAVRAEQRAMARRCGPARRSGDYLGAADAFIEAPLARAAGVLA